MEIWVLSLWCSKTQQVLVHFEKGFVKHSVNEESNVCECYHKRLLVLYDNDDCFDKWYPMPFIDGCPTMYLHHIFMSNSDRMLM